MMVASLADWLVDVTVARLDSTLVAKSVATRATRRADWKVFATVEKMDFCSVGSMVGRSDERTAGHSVDTLETTTVVAMVDPTVEQMANWMVTMLVALMDTTLAPQTVVELVAM